MADESAAACSKLTLNEEEYELVELGGIDDSRAQQQISLLLVGRLLTMRHFNVEAFKRTMTQSWTLSANEQPSNVPLTHSPFWTRIYNLPLNYRSDDDVKTIVANYGSIMDIEPDDLCLENFRSVKLKLDVSKPLRRYQRIKGKDGNIIRVEFKYERLPFFCYVYSIMGHSEKDCDLTTGDDQNGGMGWGSWLRASPRKGKQKFMEEVEAVKSSRGSVSGDQIVDKGRKRRCRDDMEIDTDWNSAGMGLWWKDVNVRVISFSTHHFMVEVLDDNNSDMWRAVGIYGWPEKANKYKTWELMKSLKFQAEVRHLPIYCSDHAPIIFTVGKETNMWAKKKLFKYESFWLSKPECEEVIRNSWREELNQPADIKLAKCASVLEEWAATVFGDVKKRIRRNEKLLKRLQRRAMDASVLEQLKSGYWFGVLGPEMNQQGYLGDEVWKRVWGVDGPPKLHHFLWRACSGSLAVNEIMCHRHMRVDSRCSLCLDESETIVHSIFTCAASRDIWASSHFTSYLLEAPTTSFKGCFMWMARKLNKDELSLLATLAWASWTSRNKRIYHNSDHDPRSIAVGFSKYVADYKRYALNVFGARSSLDVRSAAGWNPPPSGVVKVNTDAAVFDGGGVGLAIAEAAAINYGLHLARRLNYMEVWLECDAMELVGRISSGAT
ncbi:hypothetical protein RDABS01_031287 [Bienertia sinuspersici]